MSQLTIVHFNSIVMFAPPMERSGSRVGVTLQPKSPTSA